MLACRGRSGQGKFGPRGDLGAGVRAEGGRLGPVRVSGGRLEANLEGRRVRTDEAQAKVAEMEGMLA